MPTEAAPGVPWLQGFAQLVTTVGFPVVVAGACIWFLMTRVSTALREIQAEEERRTAKVAEMQAALIRTLEHNAERFEHAVEKLGPYAPRK